MNHTTEGFLKIERRRPTRWQRYANRALSALPHRITNGYQIQGRLVDETDWFPNLILNGALGNTGWFNNPANTLNFQCSTDSTVNYLDNAGTTWNQVGNTVTRATGTGTVPTGHVANEVKWQDGERCHILTRISDTSFTVSGPARTITGKTLRVYFTNWNTGSGIMQSKVSANPTFVSNLAAGTYETTWSVTQDAAASAYTLASVVLGGTYARVVLPAPIAVAQFDQLSMVYKRQATVSGREAQTVALSSIITGFPYKFAVTSITGNGTTVTVVTSEAHNLVALDPIVIAGAVPLRTAVQSASSTSTTWTVNSTGHGKSVGDTVVHENFSVAGYNGTFTIATVPNANSYTVTNASNPGASTGGTTRLATPVTYFNGSYTVATAPNSTTLTFTNAITGPAVDPGPILTTPDEATVSYWGGIWGNAHDQTPDAGMSVMAVAEANKITAPPVSQNFNPAPVTVAGSASIGSVNTGWDATYLNDWTARSTPASSVAWSAGGTAVMRVAQILLQRAYAVTFGGPNLGSGCALGCIITFRVPQPKLTTHRLAWPSQGLKMTRELPNY